MSTSFTTSTTSSNSSTSTAPVNATPTKSDLIFATHEDRLIHFPQLQEVVYLDHAGATVPSKAQIDALSHSLLTQTFGNPHSVGPAASLSKKTIDSTKIQVLQTLFNTTSDDYTLIFTSGATAGLKLVGECFPWQSSSKFAYMRQSHNSVVGMREYAKQKNATMCAYTNECTVVNELIDRGWVNNSTMATTQQRSKSLLAIPGECNFSGKRFDLTETLNHDMFTAEGRHWYTLLDASKLVATSPVDLQRYKPDFVVASFYKIVGYPTGEVAFVVAETT